MPSGRESTTALSVDAEIDDVLDREFDTPEAREDRLRRAVEGDARMRFGLARRLLRERKALERLNDEERALHEEYARAASPISERIAVIEETFRRMALRQREAGGGNSLVVPGVGVFRAHARPSRWDVDNAALLASLDRESPFIDPGQPRPPEPKVRGRELRAHLNELLDTALAGRGKVPEEERIEIARAVAAAFDGVAYVPQEIKVDFEEEVRDGG